MGGDGEGICDSRKHTRPLEFLWEGGEGGEEGLKAKLLVVGVGAIQSTLHRKDKEKFHFAITVTWLVARPD